jgi:FKBP-type peptidyl-prolyl cis-trans isomerase 2
LIKKGDFVELDYTAKLKDEQLVFDTTSEVVAKAVGSYNSKFKYGPVIICVGERQLIAGLDDALIGKPLSKFSVYISAENGFGKKNAKLLKLIPLKLFQKDKVQPHAGLEVNIDGQVGMVKNVSGGRVIVDFNHPLSGRDLVYDVELKRMVTDPLEKVRAVLHLIHLPHTSIDIMEDKAEVSIPAKIPEEVLNEIANDLKRLSGLKEIKFTVVEPAKKEVKNHDHANEPAGHKH